MRILNIVNDLSVGGAQKMLLRLVVQDTKLNDNQHIILVLKWTDDCIRFSSSDGFEVYYLFKGVKATFCAFIRIYKFQPNVIQSWLYISDLISLFFKLILPCSKLVWNIRNGRPSRRIISRYSFFSAWICSKLSFVPSTILSPSKTAISEHIEFGYCKKNFVYIPNFIDPVYVHYMTNLSKDIAKKQTIIFGVVTRFDEQKGLDTLLSAISKLPLDLNIRFHFIGNGMTKENIVKKLEVLHLPNPSYEFCCRTKRDNLIEFYQEIDFHISPSKSEAFPNAVFESMYMGKPNIATNAGDSDLLISDIGFLINVNDPEALSGAIMKCVALYNCSFKEYQNLATLSHQRIKTSFSLSKVLKQYNDVWKN
jgi:glycosyltransferase involved in cell wall biosynthesis